jgi:pimeloyl-ACP methyl ester carboxylesterase
MPGKRGARNRFVASLVITVALVAASMTIAAGSPAASAPVRAVAKTAAVRPAVQWAPCVRPQRAKCGHVAVPFDPADPSAGTIAIGFELHTRRQADLPSLGTIVATEGGPGYATTASRTGYLDLFHPLLDRRDFLLVDNRGTGTSDPIKCSPLQSFNGNYINRIGLCGQQLGSASDLYGTAFAADDLALVLDALGIDTIDLYGDSYGTFFGQTFAVRHPDRLRTLVLDSTYPVEGQDPWYRDENRAMVDAIRLACRRSPACASRGGDPVQRIRAVDDRLRAHPIVGTAFDGDGVKLTVTVDPGAIGLLVASAAYGPPIYRELDGAIRAYMNPTASDPGPLLRMVAENEPPGKAGPVRQYSQGLYLAAICNDYPQLWDINAPIAQRDAQYSASLASLRATDPNAFYPFTIADWTHSLWTEFRSCIQWPVPSNYVFPVPQPAHYPKVPTLVLSGDLDSLTSPEGAHTVAARFPNSTFVSIANGTHVTAESDFGRCTSVIVVRFVASKRAGDTSCAAKYNEVREVEQFPRTLAAAAPAPQGARVLSSATDRRVADVVSNTVADALPRWFTNFDGTGVGLRGGGFSYTGSSDVVFTLKGLRWVDDVAVSGTLDWNRTTGWITAAVTVAGPAGESGALNLRWRDWDVHAVATVQGQIGGRPLDLQLPAS